MNTFNIDASSYLAADVVNEIRSLNPDSFVAIRGEIDPYGDEAVYGVFEYPGDGSLPPRGGYIWSYVQAKSWLSCYDFVRRLG